MLEIIENFVDPVTKTGVIRHRWVNPKTHWCEMVEIGVHIFNGEANLIRMSYDGNSFLGAKKDITQAEVAYALSYALQLAGARLEQLYKEHKDALALAAIQSANKNKEV